MGQKHWSESRDQTSRMSFSNDARLINKDLGRIIAETTPSPTKKKHCLPQTSRTWITRTGPRPSPVLYIHSLILESSELIYVKLQNVLMTPYDIETICGGLFDEKENPVLVTSLFTFPSSV